MPVNEASAAAARVVAAWASAKAGQSADAIGWMGIPGWPAAAGSMMSIMAIFRTVGALMKCVFMATSYKEWCAVAS